MNNIKAPKGFIEFATVTWSQHDVYISRRRYHTIDGTRSIIFFHDDSSHRTQENKDQEKVTTNT